MADEKKDQPQNAEPSKIKLNGNHHTDKAPPVASTAPPKIKLEAGLIQTPPVPIAGESLKRSTLRIDLPGSDIVETAPPDELKKQTSRVQLPDEAGTPKKTTARIELPDTVPATPGGAKKATNRVQLPDTVTDQAPPSALKKHTTRMDFTGSTTGAEAQKAKKTTARIELGDTLGATRVAAPELELPAGHQIPRTVRIKQPEAAPTVVARKIPEIISAGGVTEARKSETARIELPPETIVEEPVTRRKTIRIKRPGAEGESPTTTRAPIALARAAPEQTEKSNATLEAEVTVQDVVAEEAGLLDTVCAVAALIIASALVYVLAAQTIAPNLPFPGKV
ncbi:MAG: hypothetical protein EPN23_03135 [Verrucomicrobia bacterium]|nr:MAG: hypothetical protein EPN23_03135 [Verrucomicrobiota bacterium]